MKNTLVTAMLAFSASVALAQDGKIHVTNTSGSTSYARWLANGVAQQTIGAIAAGATWDSSVLVNAYNGNTITVEWGPSSGVYPYAGSPASYTYVYASGTTMPFTIGSVPGPDTNMCNITLCAKNNDSRYRIFSVYKAGAEYTISIYPGGIGIAAGATGCVTWREPCTNASGFYLDLAPGEVGFNNPVTNMVVTTNSSPYGYPGVTNAYTAQNPGTFNPTNAGSGVSNIVWTSTSYTNAIYSQQQGDAAVYDAVNKFAQGTDINLRGINSNIVNLRTTMNGLSNTASGQSNLSYLGMLTNGNGFGSVTGAIRAFHYDNTNLLGAILRGQTNSANTNTVSIPSLATNVTEARAAAEALTDGITSSADDALDSLGSTAPSIGSSGSPTVFTLAIAGQTLNLDPEVRFPGIGTIFQGGIMLIVSLALGRYLANLYKDTAAVYASSQTGGSPDLNILGVNAAGPVVGLACAAVIVALWVTVFALLFTLVLDHLLAVRGNADGWTTGNAGADYLINYFFPLSFLMASAWTRIVAPIAVTKLVVVTNSIQRFLIAK